MQICPRAVAGGLNTGTAAVYVSLFISSSLSIQGAQARARE